MAEHPDTAQPLFAEQHRQLEAGFDEHLLALVGAEFSDALQHLRHWHRALLQHIHIEDNLLLPHVPADARWPARLYLLEHQRIRDLAQDYLKQLQAVAAQPPAEPRARRRAVLALIDAAHPLRHLCEHHHEREEMALAHELSVDLQQQAWATLTATS